MKKKKPTRSQVATHLCKKFSKSPRTPWNWFARGCPDDSFEDAEQWAVDNEIKPSDPSAPKPVKQASPVLIYDPTPLRDTDDPDPESVGKIVQMRLAGESQRRIAQETGLSMSVVSRVIRQHPLTQEKDRLVASDVWKDVRRLSADRLRDILLNDEAASRLKASELAVIAAISQDKIDKSEAPKEATITLRAKIEAMSWNELIQALPARRDIMEAEFEQIDTPLPDESQGTGAESQMQAACKKTGY